MADDTILSSAFQVRSHPSWEPKNAEERLFISKPESVEWDFQSTEVDVQLSVVKQNLMSLINDMQGYVSPDVIGDVVGKAMEADEHRMKYRELSEKYGKFTNSRDNYLTSLDKYGKDIIRRGHDLDDITFQLQCRIAMRKKSKRDLAIQIFSYILFPHCPLMRTTALNVPSGPLLSPSIFHDEEAATSTEDDVGQERRMITNMYECCRQGGYAVLSADEIGVDKTTFARKLYERAVKDTNEFQLCAWVTALPGYDIRDICVAIAEHHDRSNRERANVLKVKSSEIKGSDEQVMKMMHGELKNLSYMLVLDDVHYVWPEIQLDTIRHLFPVQKNTVVIFTTRRDQVLSHNHYGFELFQRSLEKAHVTLNKNTEEPNLSRIIEVSKEARWPQVRTLARLYVTYYSTYKLLSEQERSSLASLISWDWQYHMLPPRIRHCYLYMALFPEEFDIPIRRLLRLWIAEGLVIKSDLPSTKTLEDVALNYLMQLQRTTMIQVTEKNGRPKTCRIRADKYKFFSEKAKDLGVVFYVHKESDFSVADSSSPPKTFNPRRVADHADVKNYPNSDSGISHLRSYINFTRKRDTPALQVGDLLDRHTKRGFGLLRVLDLEDVYKPLLKEETLGKLFLLTYLGLRWTFLDSLPDSVGALQHLETLDVKHTNITTLSSSIWKAKNLRHLYMNQVHLYLSTKKDFAVASTNLQTLWGLSIGSNSRVVNWLTELSELRKLGLTYNPSTARQIAKLVEKLTHLQSLRLRSLNEFGKPSELMLPDMTELKKLSDMYLVGELKKLPNPSHPVEFKFPTNLKNLTLTGSKLRGSDMRLLGKLNQLSTLRLYAQSFLDNEIIFHDEEFPKLVVLKLWVLDELKTMEMQVGSLPILEELDIRRCINLKDVKGLKQQCHHSPKKEKQQCRRLRMITLTNMSVNFVEKIKSEVEEDHVEVKINKFDFSSASTGKGGGGASASMTVNEELD